MDHWCSLADVCVCFGFSLAGPSLKEQCLPWTMAKDVGVGREGEVGGEGRGGEGRVGREGKEREGVAAVTDVLILLSTPHWWTELNV